MTTAVQKKPKESTKPVPTTTTSQIVPTLGRNLSHGVNVIRDELDRIFTRFASELHSLLATNGTAWKWSFDITDEDEAIVVRAEAPGFEAKDFDIQLEDTRLVLRANKTHTKEEAGKKSEVTDVACYESIDLPATIDKDKIEARYHNGVLTITLPKTADAKARRIKVKAE